MESTKFVIVSIHQEGLLAFVDIKSTYPPIRICSTHQHFQWFAVLHYQFVALPFDPSSAPLVFTKVLAPVLALLFFCDIPFVGYLVDKGSVRQSGFDCNQYWNRLLI